MRNPHTSAPHRQAWESAYLRTRRLKALRRFRLRRLLCAPPTAPLLDLGSGDGLDLEVLRELGFTKMIALDSSPGLLSRNPSKARVAGDVQRLPFRDESFVTLLADSVLHHLTDYGQAAKEIARVLRTEGKFFYMEPRPSLVRRLLDWITFAPIISALLPPLAARKQSLLEEWDLHHHWLENMESMEMALTAPHMRPFYRRLGLAGIFACFQKALPRPTEERDSRTTVHD